MFVFTADFTWPLCGSAIVAWSARISLSIRTAWSKHYDQNGYLNGNQKRRSEWWSENGNDTIRPIQPHTHYECDSAEPVRLPTTNFQALKRLSEWRQAWRRVDLNEAVAFHYEENQVHSELIRSIYLRRESSKFSGGSSPLALTFDGLIECLVLFSSLDLFLSLFSSLHSLAPLTLHRSLAPLYKRKWVPPLIREPL